MIVKVLLDFADRIVYEIFFAQQQKKSYGIGYLLIGGVLFGVNSTIFKYMDQKSASQTYGEHQSSHEKFSFLKSIRVPIVYHEDYNIVPWGGLEDAHSFDGEKYGKIMRMLRDQKLLSTDWVHKPLFPERSTLKLVWKPNTSPEFLEL